MTYTEIQTRIYNLTGTDVNSFTDANLTIAVGEAQRHVISLIMMSDLRWRWDDSNLTDLPIATAALVEDQQDYSIDSGHLIIDRMEIKDSSSNWHLLSPIDQSLLKRGKSSAMTEYQEGAGLPNEYDLIGNSIFLYPKPNYSQAASLKVYFVREPLLFDYSDDKFTDDTGSATSTPGFNALFHDLIPLTVAYEYASIYHLDRARFLLVEKTAKEKALQDFYAQRHKDARPRFTVSQESDRSGGLSSYESGRL